MDTGTVMYTPVKHDGPDTLIVIDDGRVSSYRLSRRSEWTFGRLPDRDICVSSPIVSRRHGKFCNIKGRWYYQHNGTLNPTFINGIRIPNDVSNEPLHDGDVIRVDYENLKTPDSSGVLILYTRNPSIGKWKVFKLSHAEGDEAVIGRLSGKSDIVQPLPYISAQHARIQRHSGHYYVYDLGSKIGTYINDEEITGGIRLVEKDIISIGDCRFYYTQDKLIYDQRGEEVLSKTRRLRENNNGKNDLNKTESVDNIDDEQAIIRVNIQRKKVGIFGSRILLHDVHFPIPEHSLTGIIGLSGAGKSLIMNCASGRDTSYEGQVLFRGRDLKKCLKQVSALIGYVPQGNVFNSELKLYEDVYHAAKVRLPQDSTDEEICRRVDFTLEALGLAGLSGQGIKSLSGGQQRRASLGRELVAMSPMYFLDEPDAGLSELDKYDLFVSLRNLVHPEALTFFGGDVSSIVMIVHDVNHLDLLDRLVVVSPESENSDGKRGAGTLAFYGKPSDALSYFSVNSYANIFRELQRRLHKGSIEPFHIEKV